MENKLTYRIHVSAIIDGTEFLPRKLLAMTSLPLEDYHEAGDAWVRKTYSGTYKDGSASLVATLYPHSEGIQPFEDLLDTVIVNYESIKACGGTSITIWVALFNSVQGNWSMSEKQVQKLAAFNGSLAVSYYDEGDPVRSGPIDSRQGNVPNCIEWGKNGIIRRDFCRI